MIRETDVDENIKWRHSFLMVLRFIEINRRRAQLLNNRR